MNLATVLIVVLLGVACLAMVVAVGAIVYQVIFRKKKTVLPQETLKPPTLPPNS